MRIFKQTRKQGTGVAVGMFIPRIVARWVATWNFAMAHQWAEESTTGITSHLPSGKLT